MIEFVVRHDDARWSAEWSGCVVEGSDLTALERAIADLLHDRLGARCPDRVAMRFDHGSLPRWLRQYQSHYFNYRLCIPTENPA